jgi:hypothetical protein
VNFPRDPFATMVRYEEGGSSSVFGCCKGSEAAGRLVAMLGLFSTLNYDSSIFILIAAVSIGLLCLFFGGGG